MITIYLNPKCKKSRAGLQYLQDKGLEVTIVEYLKHYLTREDLKDILVKLNLKVQDIIRVHEDVYKESFKGKNFTDEEWIEILVEYPKLIKRPIVVKGYKAVIGDPVGEIEKLLK